MSKYFVCDRMIEKIVNSIKKSYSKSIRNDLNQYFLNNYL